MAMGKLEPARCSVASVTAMTEDWLWFRLAMVDKESSRVGKDFQILSDTHVLSTATMG
ncbi:hypothetical protein K438DRAFT_1993298 [Mycena galopus ATCC 62051]|nr:hypothetical protein K438DRAFT_1993298 [Mycena galopus ATCC 62051]